MRLAASLDQVSGHVLASAVVGAAAGRGCELVLPQQVEEVPGQGIRGMVDGHRVAVGKAGWVGVTGQPAWVKAARRRARLDGALTVFVAVNGVRPVRSSWTTRSGPMPPGRSGRCAMAGSAGSSWSPATAQRSPTRSAR